MSFEPLRRTGGRVILDTDIGPDCDDAGALVILAEGAKRYGFEIAAVINCTSNPWGEGAADALLAFCGVSGVPLGRFMSRPFLEDCCRYNRAVTEAYSPRFRAGRLRAEHSAELYKSALLASGDGETVVVTIGQFNALAEIAEAEPALCRRKIRAVVSMAGSADPTLREYNVICDPAAARTVVRTLDVPFYFSPFELGEPLVAGFDPQDDRRDALRDAYRFYTEGAMRRSSWDLTAADFAVNGTGEVYGLSEPFRLDVADDGTFRPAYRPDGNARFLTNRIGVEALIARMDALLAGAGAN